MGGGVRNIKLMTEKVLKFSRRKIKNKSENKDLISDDRNNKVTLRLTIPWAKCSMFKSSAKDLSLEIFGFTMWANTRLEHNEWYDSSGTQGAAKRIRVKFQLSG